MELLVAAFIKGGFIISFSWEKQVQIWWLKFWLKQVPARHHFRFDSRTRTVRGSLHRRRARFRQRQRLESLFSFLSMDHLALYLVGTVKVIPLLKRIRAKYFPLHCFMAPPGLRAVKIPKCSFKYQYNWHNQTKAFPKISFFSCKARSVLRSNYILKVSK